MEIIISPEVERLQGEVKNLKAKLLVLIDEHDELVYQTCPNIAAKYAQLLGNLELEAFELENNIRKIKRKIELVREKLSKNEPLILMEIEKQLDEEFQEFANALLTAQRENREALARLECEKLSASDSKELKETYRRIAKQLHPDLNENLTEEQRELFFRAAQAYKTGDITLMRMIDAASQTFEVKSVEDENGIEKLKKQIENLRRNIVSVTEIIRGIKNEFPFNMLDVINDKEQVRVRQEKLNGVIKDYRAVYNEYKEEYLGFFPDEEQEGLL